MRTGRKHTELSRIDYLILSSLDANGATNHILGLTIKEMNITEVKRACIWKHLSTLIDKGLVCQSGNYGNQKMYYITEDGINLIKGV
jgi:predicted transcriptional regulator